MALTLGTILALLSIAVAVYPFVRRRFGVAGEGNGPAAREVAAPDTATDVAGPELGAIYDAINTLRLERDLGNIPEGLYREQLNGYRWQAALVLRAYVQSYVQTEAEAQTQSGDSDWALEEEIRVARAGLRQADSAGTGVTRCPNCARPMPAGAAQCPECGVEGEPQTLSDAASGQQERD